MSFWCVEVFLFTLAAISFSSLHYVQGATALLPLEHHGDDYERKITPHWIGRIVRRKLGLKTERRETGYVIGSGEGPKLARLLERYGLSGESMKLLNSMNSGEEVETPVGTQEPLIS